jgi:PIN domain nuclease of toxin-antitoxin system
MKYLLDTHTLLWTVANSTALSEDVRRLLVDSNHSILISVVSLWEIAIKVNIGKLSIPATFFAFVQQRVDEGYLEQLNIQPSHLQAYLLLPLHHRDPFDRMLIAQAQGESALLISRDPAFDPYSVRRVW